MIWFQVFQDGPEYEARKHKGTFTPPNISMKDIRAAVRPELFERSTVKSLYYIARHLFFTFGFYCIATHISNIARFTTNVPVMQQLVRGVLWILYWGWQGVAFAGIWCLGKSTNNIERDETYIPPTRQDFQLPDGKVAVRMDYTEILEETPAFTLFKLFIRQFFGFQLYLIHNRKGNPRYPPGTSHYMPSSKLFKPEQRKFIIVSNIAIGSMLVLIAGYIYQKSWSDAWFYYFAPWLVAHNWIVMLTYLQHSDPTIPYYRSVDLCPRSLGYSRPTTLWVDHLAHHFFATIPFYNLPQVTEAIKPVLGEYYNYDSTPALYALWRSFTQCTFVESEGDILFFKNQHGEAIIEPRI
ncbi:Delta(12) fatty acid desaturase [Termitomyces sp. J132]|nr:Delta(12) fatty acid desaturase [Termitomyces sp. J132]